MRRKIILGSASPRRRELLSQIGVEFTVKASEKEEVYHSSTPEEIVKELGGSIQAGAVSVIALAMAYGVYAGYFKQMIETFFNGLCG